MEQPRDEESDQAVGQHLVQMIKDKISKTMMPVEQVKVARDAMHADPHLQSVFMTKLEKQPDISSEQLTRLPVMMEIIDLIIEVHEMSPPYGPADVDKVQQLIRLMESIDYKLEQTNFKSSAKADNEEKPLADDAIKPSDSPQEAVKGMEDFNAMNMMCLKFYQKKIQETRDVTNKLIDRLITAMKQFKTLKDSMTDNQFHYPQQMTDTNDLLQIATDILHRDHLVFASEQKVAELRKLMDELKCPAPAQRQTSKRHPKHSSTRRKHLTLADQSLISASNKSSSSCERSQACSSHSAQRKPTTNVPVNQPKMTDELKRSLMEKEKEVERLKCLIQLLQRIAIQNESRK